MLLYEAFVPSTGDSTKVDLFLEEADQQATPTRSVHIVARCGHTESSPCCSMKSAVRNSRMTINVYGDLSNTFAI